MVISDQHLTRARKGRMRRERRLAGAALEQYGIWDARFAYLKQRGFKSLFRVTSPTRGILFPPTTCSHARPQRGRAIYPR